MLRATRWLVILPLLIALIANGQSSDKMKQVLLDQLKETHSKSDWFVCVRTAMEGLTPAQAFWKEPGGNHSVAELASHLIFWNERQLQKFKGQQPQDFTGDNDETFSTATENDWQKIASRLDHVLTEWEKSITQSDGEHLKKWYATIAKVSAHNAYHTGQIVMIRKLQRTWDPEKGVK